ncbi:hypothetical protein [Micromonospora globbae]|uniref:hypothetical protein n=1 Tax=Micromonospora globbae TaxID=1894969 RepID=UPI0038692527|nr:sensor domain-containing protein [Micromonospora globbae]
MPRLVLWRLVAVGAVCLAAACGPPSARPESDGIPSTATATGSATATKPAYAVPPTGGPGYSAALSARLLSPDSAPPGFDVEIATTMSPDAGDHRPGVAVSCAGGMIPLLSAARLTGTPSTMAAAVLSLDAGPDSLWVGSEVLRTYADDGARRAMTHLRTLVGRCPTVVSPGGEDTWRFAVTPGPRLGDESVHVSCRMTSGPHTLGCDGLLVRVGTTLVVVKEEGNEPGGERYLVPLAEAAVRRYQATGSGTA